MTLAEAFQDRNFSGADLVIRTPGPSLAGVGYLTKALSLFGDEAQERPFIRWVSHPLGVVVKAIAEEEYVTLDQMDTYLHFYTGGI